MRVSTGPRALRPWRNGAMYRLQLKLATRAFLRALVGRSTRTRIYAEGSPFPLYMPLAGADDLTMDAGVIRYAADNLLEREAQR